MANFSSKSLGHLESCDKDIITIMNEVIKYVDFTVVEGNRTAERQHEHWSKGRRLVFPGVDNKVRDNWVIVEKEKIVTSKDGYEKVSKHQSSPSIAIDVVPYPTMWSDNAELDKLAGVIYTVQEMLYQNKQIDKKLMRGYELWNGFDRPHWQFKR